MTKQCGTCKWWDRGNSSLPVFGRKFLIAQCTKKFNSHAHHAGKEMTLETEGENCQVYEERKENA